MQTSLEGKVVVITAAGQGIGRATAELFVEAGALVHATDVNLELLRNLNAASIRTLDVTSDADVAGLASSLDRIDVLCNFAGVVHNGAIADATLRDLDAAFDLNVKGMFRTIQACLPIMLSNGGGSIINMASVASSLKGVPNRAVYSITKAAVIGLTKSVAADYVTQGIRCNAICPGTVETPSLRDRLNATGNYQDARRAFVARQPMGRFGDASEIANLALYLASDASSFTTGQAHIIDGGWAM